MGRFGVFPFLSESKVRGRTGGKCIGTRFREVAVRLAIA